jgi:hypothetical protein
VSISELSAALRQNWRKILKISAIILAIFAFISLFIDSDVMEKMTDVAIYAFGAVVFFVLSKADLSKPVTTAQSKRKTISESWRDGLEQGKQKEAVKQAERSKKQAFQAERKANTAPKERVENQLRGLLFAMGAPIIGVTLWLWLWSMDVMAGFVAWVIAFLVIKLYAIGAGKVSSKSANMLIYLIIDSIGLAFMSGLVASALKIYQSIYHADTWAALASTKFWHGFISLVTNPEFLAAIWQDIAFAAIFGFIGSYGYIKGLKEYAKEESTDSLAML